MKTPNFLFRTLIFILLFSLTATLSKAQTFNCYVANETLVSSTVLEFDVYIVSTSTDFNFRTAQFCFSFNPAFVPANGTVTASLVAGSSQMNNYDRVRFTTSANRDGFQVTANTGVSCATGTTISTTPLRIGRYRVTSSQAFGAASPKVSIVGFRDTRPAGLPLTVSFSKWNELDCATGTNSIITAKGTYSNLSTGVINTPTDVFNASVYPNPTSDKLTVKFKSTTEATYTFRLVDGIGKVVISEKEKVKAGVNQHVFDLSNYAKGIYTLEMQSGSAKQSFSVAVQ